MLPSTQPLPAFAFVTLPVAYGKWQLNANDDTLGGWLAVAIYTALMVLCWKAVLRPAPTRRALQRSFWIWLSIGVTALGINKQLDLQTLMIEIGWRAARIEGITQYRRGIQIVLAATAAILSAAVAGYLWRLMKRATFSERMVLVGICGLLGFVLMRAAKFNHVLVTRTMRQHRTMLAIELAFSAFLCFAVWLNGRTTHRLSSSN